LDEIQNDGFTVHAQVQIHMEKDTLASTARAIGSGVQSMTDALLKIKPDVMAIYADRFEGFAAVIASTQMGIPTAHIEGGDLTEGGALDDSVRHAMTKLSHIHFTTNEQATKRILAMGEERWRVHTVGYPAIDLIEEGRFEDMNNLSVRFSLDFKKPLVLFTQHSVTTEVASVRTQIRSSIDALLRLSEEGIQVLITYPNNDAGGLQIIEELMSIPLKEYPNVSICPSVGRFAYHGFLSLARDKAVRLACVGNSSSGIKETPVFGCPTVNIGSRQLGRLRAENVIDADYDSEEIYLSIKKCLFNEKFRAMARECSNPYGIGQAGVKIANLLCELSLKPDLIRKKMTI